MSTSRTSAGMVWRLVVLLSLTAISLLSAASPAGAHALINATEPAADAVLSQAPAHVTLTFNEAVEAKFGAIRVYDTRGRRVDDGRARHVPGEPRKVRTMLAGPAGAPLGDGTYTVSWRVTSADGHPVSEAFLFHVGEPGAEAGDALTRVLAQEDGAGRMAAITAVLGRWVLFAGLALLIGAWVFVPLVARRGGAWPDQRIAERRARLLRLAWWLALAGALAGAVTQIALAAGLPLHRALAPSLMGELLGTRYGIVAAARLLLLLIAAAMWRRGAADRALRITALVALALAATPGLSGHAGVVQPAAPAVIADALHVAAAGVWLAGLILVRRTLREDRPHEQQAALVTRFSSVALRAVALLVVTGAMRSWAEVGAPRALFGTDYGAALLLKLGVFALLLGAAAVSRWRLQPRLREPSKDGARALGRIVGVEAALAVVVLAVTAVLVSLPPAAVEAGITGPLITEAPLGEATLQVVVDPNRVGENIVHLTMVTAEGRPFEVEAMRVEFRMPAEQLGPLPADALRLGPGHYAVQGRQLSVPGTWVLTVIAQLDRFTDVSTEVSVRVN